MNNKHLAVEKLFREKFAKGETIHIGRLEKEIPLLHIEQSVNHGQQLLFDNLVEDLITYLHLIDYDGTRWDGGPMTVMSHDFLGRPFMHPETGEHVKTLAQRKALSAARMAELKRRVWEEHPQWVYGNNGDTYGYGGSLLTLERDPPDVAAYPHYREFMKDGGSYMDEGWMNAHYFADNRNKVEDYLRICFKQAHGMKAAGGYLQTFSPERDASPHYTVDCIYFTLLPHLAGATYYGQLSTVPRSEDGPIRFFIRFAEFFLDNQLRPLPDAEDLVEVDLPDVWSWEVASWREVDEDHARVVVPIINKHPRERLYATQNRYSELPQPVDDVFSVVIGAPEGYEDADAEVWELGCVPRTSARRLDADVDAGVEFEVDGLDIFKVIVVEFRR
jgi:hypothetical protein